MMVSTFSKEINLKDLKRGLYLTERDVQISFTNNLMENENKETTWIQQTGLPLEYIEKRLSDDGLNREKFKNILANRDDPTSSQEEPSWIKTLEAIFNRGNLEFENVLFDNKELDKHPFLPFLQPFLKYTKSIIDKKYNGYKSTRYEAIIPADVLEKAVIEPTCKGLLTLSMRVLIYELNLARVENRLEGESSELRFQDFIRNHISEHHNIYILLTKYPVLARLLVETMEKWQHAIFEAIDRLLKDHSLINHSFKGNFDKLVKIHTGQGDLHCNGRSVLSMEFATGEKIVYKPRSLSIDVHFNNLIQWVNSKGFKPILQPPHVINRGQYGWQEFANYEECESNDACNKFYERLGAYVAILHMLHATDMHMENMIASGEHPQFIDLESLFHNLDAIAETKLTALQKTSEELSQSVLRTAILPASLFKTGSFRSIEISGIGGHAGQRLPRPVYKLANKNTDKMKMIKEVGFHTGAKNRVMLNGEEVAPENYIPQITEGFKKAYMIFLENKDELLSHQGPIMNFKGDKVRSILRHTQSYSTMLEASLHPDKLKNGLDRVHLFDYLWRIVKFNSKMEHFISSETRDLLNGDIPYFVSEVDSLSVWDSQGKEIKNFFLNSALDHTLRRVEDFSLEDCKKQIRYIQTSMATMLKRWDFKEYRSNSSKFIPEKISSREDFINEARKIGDKLLQSSFWGDDKKDINWIGIGASLNDRWLFTPLDATLYDGVLGVSLFYAYLSEVSGEISYKNVAKAAVNSANDFLERYDGLSSLSAFHGYASISYVFSHLSVLWNDEKYMNEALQALYQCEKWIEKDNMYDLIGGVAGTLLVSLRLYKLTGCSRALNIAIKCGEHLIKNARKQKEGYGWVSFMDNETALVGLSHGAAGIAWALSELYAQTNDKRFLEFSKQAIRYERSMFIPDEGNWADLRYREERKNLGISTPVQWCHGSAGIALGRLMTKLHWEDAEMNKEIDVAIKTTLEEGFGGSHCQCHGDFGNIEVLLLASDILCNDDLLEKAQQIGSSIVKEAEESGWFCGIPQNEETPGFMLGLAGVGYGLLRLANPNTVPPVVTLGTPLRDGK
ncbi:type 2 lanthipeptide synthetase LanM family protein [Priestia megaterium]|uniref:type 2 lanthipeptide synthetase LanM family protein n=1 Tax=Priestia megaterium TaxID=1404 RepID=UPI0009BE8F76|nr:type 2 lanthipeptide synthetase LanM family protein [Priestia megaterium]